MPDLALPDLQFYSGSIEHSIGPDMAELYLFTHLSCYVPSSFFHVAAERTPETETNLTAEVVRVVESIGGGIPPLAAVIDIMGDGIWLDWRQVCVDVRAARA